MHAYMGYIHSYMLTTTQIFLANIPNVLVQADGKYSWEFLMMKEQIKAWLL